MSNFKCEPCTDSLGFFYSFYPNLDDKTAPCKHCGKPAENIAYRGDSISNKTQLTTDEVDQLNGSISLSWRQVNHMQPSFLDDIEASIDNLQQLKEEVLNRIQSQGDSNEQ